MTHDSAKERENRFIREWRRNAAHLAAHGLYDPADEHDACGVGLAMTLHPKIQTDHENKQGQQNRHRDEVWSNGVQR